jgi:hypothetical protein
MLFNGHEHLQSERFALWRSPETPLEGFVPFKGLAVL